MTPTNATEIGQRPAGRLLLRGWRSPSSRVLWLSLVLAAGGALLTVYARRWGAPSAPVHVAWWLLVPAFALSNSFVFHLEVREEAHTFTLSELPLVMGLFFASPLTIVVGRIIGEAIYFGIRRRQAPTKLLFNLSMFLAETATAVVIFRLLSHGRSPLDPASWLPVLLAVAVADLISTTAVSQAIRYHGGARLRLASVAVASGGTAAVNVRAVAPGRDRSVGQPLCHLAVSRGGCGDWFGLSQLREPEPAPRRSAALVRLHQVGGSVHAG